MKKITLTIENLASNGSGVGRHEGSGGRPKVYFVPWGVPGDEVFVEVAREHKNYNDACLLEIIKRSPHRADPPCSYYFKCGGCQIQHIRYESQIQFKKEIVRNALRRLGHLDENCVLDVIPAVNIWNYRRRIELHRDRHGRIGFFKPASHEIVEIDRCLIADDQLNEKISELKNNPSLSPTIDLRLDDSSGFFQINKEQNEILIRLVVEFLDPQKEERIFDLYSGSGNFTFPVSQRAGSVWGVEKSSEAYQQARFISRKKEIKNIRWVHAGVVRALERFKKESIPCDKIVVNPPRYGLGDAVEGIVSFQPKRIVYVSCNPATFTRDAARLTNAGFKLEKCQPVDMFPHTVHVELAALFKK